MVNHFGFGCDECDSHAAFKPNAIQNIKVGAEVDE
jgi:hypothetical protein